LPSPTWRQRFELARFDLVDHPLSNLRCPSQLARLAIGARSRTRRERYGESRCRSWDLRRWCTACLANRPVTGHRGHRSIRPAVASTSIRSLRRPRSGVRCHRLDDRADTTPTDDGRVRVLQSASVNTLSPSQSLCGVVTHQPPIPVAITYVIRVCVHVLLGRADFLSEPAAPRRSKE
jgi:hypothetical protein